MSHIWTFSPSSEFLLQRCIEAATLVKTENKWNKKFGKQTSMINEKSHEITQNIIEIPSPVQKEDGHISINYEDLFETVENDANIQLEVIANQCNEDPNLYQKLASKLSVHTVEKIFQLIFNENEAENNFVQQFIINFYVYYVKYQYSVLCIDLLANIQSHCPISYLKLIQLLINDDTEIPSQLLLSHVTMLNEENMTKFLENIHKINITACGFVHNLQSILNAYKGSIKTDTVQNLIKNCITSFSDICKTDRNYGRLFLLFLQAEKSLNKKVNEESLIKCLDVHNSPFKRPCVNLIKELCEE